MQKLTSNIKIAQQLSDILESDRVFHAFLFIGGSNESRNEIAMYLSEKLIVSDELSQKKFEHGNFEDFIVLRKEEDRETITKDQVASLQKKLEFKPFSDKYVVIVEDAHLMNEIAQNKLLKTLEEPVSPAVFIFLTEREDALLQTIRSRCTSFYLESAKNSFDEETLNASKEFSSLVLSGSYFYKKKNCISYILNDKDESREKALAFLDSLQQNLEEEMLKGNIKAVRCVERIEKARMYLKLSHSVPYTIKQFCLAV